MSRRSRYLLLCAALLAGTVSPCGWAGGRGDHERARQALAAGEILPLATILERIAPANPGQMLEVELERRGDVWIYEIKQLQAGGAVIKLKVDARDGRVLEKKDGGQARRREGRS